MSSFELKKFLVDWTGHLSKSFDVSCDGSRGSDLGNKRQLTQERRSSIPPAPVTNRQHFKHQKYLLPYIEPTPQDLMQRLLLLALTATTLLVVNGSSACEKHLEGHQNISETSQGGIKK